MNQYNDISIEELLKEAKELSPLTPREQYHLKMINRKVSQGKKISSFDRDYLCDLTCKQNIFQKRKECIERQIKDLETQGENYKRYKQLVQVLNEMVANAMTGSYGLSMDSRSMNKPLFRELYLELESLDKTVSECAKRILKNISLDFITDEQSKNTDDEDALFNYQNEILSSIISFVGFTILNELDPEEEIYEKMLIFREE